MAILKIRDKNGNIVNVPALRGQSAYEIARDNGFEGTEQEWLDSLEGKDYIFTEADKAEIRDSLSAEINELSKQIQQVAAFTPTSNTSTKKSRYDFTRTAGGITYTDEDHSNDIVYGGSFHTELTPDQLTGRVYHGWKFGTLGSGGFISISVPKIGYSRGENNITVNYSWNVTNSNSNQPAINGALIGIYSVEDWHDENVLAYFEDYEYFGRITNGAYIGSTNAAGEYQETMREYDREGVQRDITYPASKITSWGYNSTTSIGNHIYSGATTLDISGLKPGTYRIAFVNYVCPDWPLTNIIEGSPYQILAEVEITIYEAEATAQLLLDMLTPSEGQAT